MLLSTGETVRLGQGGLLKTGETVLGTGRLLPTAETGLEGSERLLTAGATVLVHGPDRVTVHPPPLGQSETKFFLLLGPPPISKVDAIKKKLG